MELWQHNQNQNYTMSGMLGAFEASEPMMSTYDDMRSLAGGGAKPTLDYTLFGMAFFTMISLLVVGAIRHKVDQIAKEHDFFRTVLETCYHECENNQATGGFYALVRSFYALVRTEPF